MHSSHRLKGRMAIAAVTLLIAFGVAVMATFAWYIYNINSHTTNVHMAAGTGLSIQIANRYDGEYASSAVLDEFVGSLNPVSTNRVQNGFQKVLGFTKGKENQPLLVANLFGKSDDTDYYLTKLFLKTNMEDTKVYLSNIGFEDSDAENPISTAIRIGILVHETGENKPVVGEYIFEISQESNPQAEYNTATGQQGYVLDSTKTDGTTLKFTPFNSDNYCNYDKNTGAVSLKPDSLSICQLSGGANGDYGDAVQLDIYIWLEGCDEDCTANLNYTTLKNLALSFAGTKE